ATDQGYPRLQLSGGSDQMGTPNPGRQKPAVGRRCPTGRKCLSGEVADLEGIHLPSANMNLPPNKSEPADALTSPNTRTRPKVRFASIDKSALSIPEPRRLRDKVHIKYVTKRPCLICGRQPSDPHHLRFAQQPALGRKVSDEFIVPLCRTHHREVHRSSD